MTKHRFNNLRTRRKSCDDSIRATLRTEHNPCVELTEMLNYPGPLVVLREAYERQGVRFDESDFVDSDITHKNHYVVVNTGETLDFICRLDKGLESGLPAQEALQNARLAFKSRRL